MAHDETASTKVINPPKETTDASQESSGATSVASAPPTRAAPTVASAPPTGATSVASTVASAPTTGATSVAPRPVPIYVIDSPIGVGTTCMKAMASRKVGN